MFLLIICLVMNLFANDESRAYEILSNVLGEKGPYRLELLSGGLSGSKIYKVDTADKTYAFRFWNKEWIEWYPQDLVGQWVGSEAGYGPKIYYSDEADCITVMDYCPHTTIERPFEALAELLRRIHQGPKLPYGIDKAADFQESLDELAKMNLSYIDLAAIGKVRDAILANRDSVVPCHRDLHPGNISYCGGQYWAFDYTWCGMDDPYFDLGTIALFHCKDRKEERELLSFYLGREAGTKELAKLSLFKQASKMFYGFEFLKLYPSKPGTKVPYPLTNRYLTFGVAGSLFGPNDYTEFALSLLHEVAQYATCGALQRIID